MTPLGRADLRLIVTILAILTVLMLTGCKGKSSSKSSDTGGNGDPPDPGGNALALDMTWAVRNASAADLQWMANRIKVLNQYIWYATEGQMYLRNQTLKVGPGTFPDSVIIDRVFGAGGGYSQGTCTFNGAWVYIHLQHGDGCAQVWVHEFGHAVVRYNLSEEYNCNACAMGAYIGGMGEGIYQYCDTSNCNTGFRCWDGRIRQAHPTWTHPGPGGVSPTCNVTIQ